MIAGLSPSRNREIVEESLDIEISLVRKYAEAAKKSAAKLERSDIVEAFEVFVDQVDDISDAVHHRQIPMGTAG